MINDLLMPEPRDLITKLFACWLFPLEKYISLFAISILMVRRMPVMKHFFIRVNKI